MVKEPCIEWRDQHPQWQRSSCIGKRLQASKGAGLTGAKGFRIHIGQGSHVNFPIPHIFLCFCFPCVAGQVTFRCGNNFWCFFLEACVQGINSFSSCLAFAGMFVQMVFQTSPWMEFVKAHKCGCIGISFIRIGHLRFWMDREGIL